MDEANMLGRGRYLEQHGYHDAVELLLRHLKRIAAIGAKYGFSLLMWSDLFFIMRTVIHMLRQRKSAA